jgi:hypothetical protein
MFYAYDRAERASSLGGRVHGGTELALIRLMDDDLRLESWLRR